MRCVSENPLCQSDPPCDPQNSDRRYPEISEAHEADHKGRRKKFLTVLSRLAGKKLSDSMMEYFMAKDPVPGSAVPVHALHGLYDREIKEAPQYLEELFRLSKEDRPLGERWYKTYNG